MRIEYNNGVPKIILENGEKVEVTSAPQVETSIVVSCDNNSLDISGSPYVVGRIDSSMLDKVFIPKKLTRESMLKEYDRWLSRFDETLEIFNSLLMSSEKFRENNVGIKLSYETDTSTDSKQLFHYYVISLTLCADGRIIQYGPSIKIARDDDGMVGYFIGHTLYSYIKTVWPNTVLNIKRALDCNYILEEDQPNRPVGIACVLSSISKEYGTLIYQIISNYNLGLSPELILKSYSDKILTKSDLDGYDKMLLETEKRFGAIQKLRNNN